MKKYLQETVTADNKLHTHTFQIICSYKISTDKNFSLDIATFV